MPMSMLLGGKSKQRQQRNLTAAAATTSGHEGGRRGESGSAAEGEKQTVRAKQNQVGPLSVCSIVYR